MRMIEFFKSKLFLTVSGVIITLFVGIIDYLTGTRLSFSIFYVLPISLVTWYVNRNAGVLLSFVSAITWFVADIMAGHVYFQPLVPYWNMAVRLGFFLIIVVILSRLRIESERRAKLIQELQDTLAELKQTERELDLKAQELVRSNIELEQFAYTAAHDLKEPLLIVGGYIKLLHRRYRDRLGPDADKLISSASEGIFRMEALINGLMAYARVGSKGKDFELTDLNKVVGHAASNLHHMIEETGALVTHDNLPLLMADEVQLVQLFQNLIGNAIKFRGDEPPRIHISAEQKGNEWIFSVCDNGIGIDPRHSDKIFGIFQRVHPKEDYPGAGIGLSICKKIVERHVGRIWVESEPEKGSTFYFTVAI